jgi:hypothetical protein
MLTYGHITLVHKHVTVVLHTRHCLWCCTAHKYTCLATLLHSCQLDQPTVVTIHRLNDGNATVINASLHCCSQPACWRDVTVRRMTLRSTSVAVAMRLPPACNMVGTTKLDQTLARIYAAPQCKSFVASAACMQARASQPSGTSGCCTAHMQSTADSTLPPQRFLVTARACWSLMLTSDAPEPAQLGMCILVFWSN